MPVGKQIIVSLQAWDLSELEQGKHCVHVSRSFDDWWLHCQCLCPGLSKGELHACNM